MFIRNCPICKIELTYVSKNSLNKAEKKQTRCKKCMGDVISLKSKGVSKSDEHKKSLSIAKIGSTLSESHKLNIGKSGKGLTRSIESRLKYSLSKMGDKNPAKENDVRDKISRTLIKYFNENPNYVSREQLDEYKIFRKDVENLTRRNKKYLLENWNGMDYYDLEYIEKNFELEYNDECYPTIDHKISILKGFKSGMSYKDIANIDNLCITKRKLNIMKANHDELEFRLMIH